MTAPQFSPGSDARVMQAKSFYDFFGVNQCDIMVLAREMTTAAKAKEEQASSPKLGGEAERERLHRRDRAAAAAALAAFADRPPSWWLAQLMKYALRPRPRVLRDFVAPMQAQAFGSSSKADGSGSGSGSGSGNNATSSSPDSSSLPSPSPPPFPPLPHPLASVFIRGGDKGRESALLPARAYFDELEPLAERLGIRDVYVSSDDGDAIEAVRRAYGGFRENVGGSGGNGTAAAADGAGGGGGSGGGGGDGNAKKQDEQSRRRQYRVHAIDWPRPRGGVTFAQVLAWRDRPEMEATVRLALADVFVTAQADVQAGTLSSNWCRVGDMLRRANGRGRLPYVTPERPSLWVASCESVEPEGKDYAARAAEFPRARAKLWEATAPSWVER